jgi:hypothetical protein
MNIKPIAIVVLLLLISSSTLADDDCDELVAGWRPEPSHQVASAEGCIVLAIWSAGIPVE